MAGPKISPGVNAALKKLLWVAALLVTGVVVGLAAAQRDDTTNGNAANSPAMRRRALLQLSGALCGVGNLIRWARKWPRRGSGKGLRKAWTWTTLLLCYIVFGVLYLIVKHVR